MILQIILYNSGKLPSHRPCLLTNNLKGIHSVTVPNFTRRCCQTVAISKDICLTAGCIRYSTILYIHDLHPIELCGVEADEAADASGFCNPLDS